MTTRASDGEDRERRVDDRRWREMTARLDRQDEAIAQTLTVAQEVKANTLEIVEFFQAGKGFFTVVRMVGTAAKWVGTVAAGTVIVWAVFKYGIAAAIEQIRSAR